MTTVTIGIFAVLIAVIIAITICMLSCLYYLMKKEKQRTSLIHRCSKLEDSTELLSYNIVLSQTSNQNVAESSVNVVSETIQSSGPDVEFTMDTQAESIISDAKDIHIQRSPYDITTQGR